MQAKIIKVSNPNVLLLQVLEEEKIVDLNIKKNSYQTIKYDKEIQDIFSEYKKKKYMIGISESGDKDPEEVMSNILEYEISKLVKANGWTYKK